MVEELTLNEIINQAAAASAGCLCAQIPAIGFRAWFPIPAERLAWGRGERAISVTLHATDLTLLQTQTLHLIGWAQSCRCLPTSHPVNENDLLVFQSGCLVLNFTFA